VFGAVRMGYVLVESNRLDDWRRFLEHGIGLHRAHADASSIAYRIDAHARRFIVRRGAAEDLVAVGWHARDEQTLERIARRLSARGIAVERGSAADAALRGVGAFARVRGPKGLAVELFADPVVSDEPLELLVSGFVTGAGGMGHIALTTRQPEKTERFWRELFDARVSDRLTQPLGGLTIDAAFLRLNERHHSVAIVATRSPRLDPIRTKVQHVNLQAATLDDLSGAFRRLRKLGYAMAHEIGQHPNDKELSFYVVGPSGFEVELGWNPIVIDEATWHEGRYDAISAWGHKPANNSALSNLAVNLGNMRRGLQSLLTPEYNPIP